MSIISSFSSAWGILVAKSDNQTDTIAASRNAAGQLLINNGTVSINGDIPTIANTRSIQLIGLGGDDVLILDESGGALPMAVLIGGNGDDQLTGGSSGDHLRGESGNDTLQGRLGVDRLSGGDGNDSLIGGDGNDLLFGESGNDIFIWNPGDDSDVIDGGTDIDTLLFNGSNVSESINISANADHVNFFRNVANVVMDLNNTEVIEFFALGGADTITVGNLTGTDVSEVNIHLSAIGGGGDGQVDTVITHATDGDDVIEALISSATRIAVSGLPALTSITDAESIDRLVINGFAGTDTISADTLLSGTIGLTVDGGDGNDTIIGSRGGDQLLGGNDNDFIDGQAGNDLALMGAGDDVFQWDPGDGSDIIEGQAGFDTLDFNGSNASENIDISANGGRVIFFRNVANIAMDLNDVEHIRFSALGGADNMVVGNLSGTDATQVEIDLAGSTGSNAGDGQVDSVTVNGTTAGDVISVTETGGQILVNGLPAQVRIAHAEVNDRLILNGQSGDDVIDASTLASGMPGLDFNGGLGGDILIGSQNGDRFLGGDGNDVAIMGPGDDSFVWNPGDDNDVIEGGTGFDTLLFNGSNVSENISISANGGRASFFRDVANVTMDLNDTEAIEFMALGGADTITVNNLAGTDITEVDINLGASGGGGDGQADVINVMATAADDVILVTMAGSDIIILGLAATVVVRNFEAANDRLHVSGLGGDDVIDASGAAVPVFLDGGDDDDVLLGGSANDILFGGNGDDVLIGNAGLDILDGGLGDNILIQ
ncbi:MAG: calcium-binding protein [Burkholderiales bacterium]|nr:calcium-binding protein [Burkholderiales bacterium]